MPDYQNSKIYRIVCNITGKQYIGSTRQSLSKRLAKHRCDFKRGICITSREIIENGNYDIILVENYSCNNKDELHKRERYFIEILDCVNKVIPGRTMKEYRQDNKDIINEKKKQYYENNKEHFKQYYENNKDVLNEKSKQHYENNKEHIREKSKQYREDNKEYFKQYYENNKDVLIEKGKQTITCECGSVVRKYTINRHYKSKKHIKYLEKK